MRILITDLNIKLDGHKFGYVSNLLKYIEGLDTDNEYFILVNFSREFKLTTNKPNIKILTTTEEQQLVITSQKHYFQKSAEEWKIIHQECLHKEINHLVLMELDPYQVEIGKTKTNYSIAGIWFRPYARMKKEGPGLRNQIVFWRTILQKKLTIKWALMNKNLKKVFILNDEAMPNWLDNRRYFYLPDPYFEYQTIESFDLRERYIIPKENLILLQFGNMDERKNNENIIAALNSLDPIKAQKITLIIIGKFKDGYLEKIKKLIPENAKYQTIIKDEFVSDEEMESTFKQSDVILRMNINFFGSSGIVGQAANHNKPCIVSNNGVMAEQVEKYKLGSIIDPYDIYAIKDSIVFYLENPNERKIDGSFYKQTHDLEAFGSTLLNV
ncbi:glycosyltransferase [Lacihabitans soyangensis]|uniref:Glycosyltransferase n=1 Tax=Lacihabitans soyangensis TaxID=869394 RepID=A0AAE3GYI5_9BACT|nr:glycosyltransferase [Lacihabitans soyangensis]MCP9761567.1 glycosyltransferase [Lacihabitans soyangensis]